MPRNEKRVTNGINDLILADWKNYDDLLVESLWLIDERDKSGAHSNNFHGNFIPQIPHQLIRRFTKVGDIVLDGFLGSGTSLIETQRLGRHGIGIELQEDLARKAEEIIFTEHRDEDSSNQTILIGDSRDRKLQADVSAVTSQLGREKVNLILLHPPYHDIIRFSEDIRDLSNLSTTQDFVTAFGEVIDNLYPLLDINGHIAIVIGDKYQNGEWIPLGFYLMAETTRRAPGLVLKSTIVKNMTGNRAKRGQDQLWRYRSLSGGFYVFKHEYIFLFRKIK